MIGNKIILTILLLVSVLSTHAQSFGEYDVNDWEDWLDNNADDYGIDYVVYSQEDDDPDNDYYDPNGDGVSDEQDDVDYDSGEDYDNVENYIYENIAGVELDAFNDIPPGSSGSLGNGMNFIITSNGYVYVDINNDGNYIGTEHIGTLTGETEETEEDPTEDDWDTADNSNDDYDYSNDNDNNDDEWNTDDDYDANDDPDNTADPDDGNQQPSDITNLTTLTNHPQIIAQINDLITAVDNPNTNVELGFQATDNLDGTYSFLAGIPSTDGEGIAFPLASTESVLEGHIHNDGTGQTRVFSHDDIFGIATLFKAHQNENATVLLVTMGGIYAMRVNDATKALDFFNKYNIETNGELDLDKLEKEWKKKVYDAVTTDCTPDPACSEADLNQELANFLSDEDTGFTLFEATIHPQQQTNSFTLTWEIVIPTP